MLLFDVVEKRLLAIARFDYTDGGSDIGMKLSLDKFTKASCVAGKNGLGGDALCRGKRLEEVKIFVGQGYDQCGHFLRCHGLETGSNDETGCRAGGHGFSESLSSGL